MLPVSFARLAYWFRLLVHHRGMTVSWRTSFKFLVEQNEDGGKRRDAAKRKELDAAEKRIAELSNIFKRLYEDGVSGRISDERFMELSADYETEQKKLKERAAELEKELAKTREATAADGRMHGNLRRQEIDIYYSFVGKVDLPE